MTQTTDPESHHRAPVDPDAPGETHLIVAKDEEVVIEHHIEDWLVFVIFWGLAGIVFLQFFTRYVLNDSLAWTEEIARYGLMWVVFIGAAMVTRRNAHIGVELVSNLLGPGPLQKALFILIDIVRVIFIALLAYFSITIVERMDIQRMTVIDLPMSYVYGGIAVGCFLMLYRQLETTWRNYKRGWTPVQHVTPAAD
ncbi:sialic acid TRAP transporter permease protein SiaT [Variibacter gotjawalensis]|uniref:TRAP transporter small permease protein n=1 Tax=Variibacter gotjawalensis TaxID=1333996 RepID=A0A0S3PUL6_9BRAD|nr:TRAP transporter small permease [Variibacter gotjawalensis]NIK49980.1 TRAP-type C4-dicarboxylate transport system permease small subunit [Variibacter gotjawalensis]RZS45979.1 TRAP-type C4-dicarboxylate transport system permease small subunit [Variibacter gotjawalensis]BAT59654.1 sialic acid TRAP transporter permease protein SiaT [Variibacter gotjawalensis]